MNKARTLSTAFVAIVAMVPFAASAESGLYFGGSIGSATLKDTIGSFDIDADSNPYRLTVGLQFNDFFAIEGGYQNFGTFEDRYTFSGQPVDIALEADGITLGAAGSLPVSETFSLFGRAGAFFWDSDALIDSIRQPSENDTNVYFGGGGTVSISERLKLVGDWTRYELESTESDVISLGFTYRF